VIVGVIRRKPVLTHASIVCEGMLASVNSVNQRTTTTTNMGSKMLASKSWHFLSHFQLENGNKYSRWPVKEVQPWFDCMLEHFTVFWIGGGGWRMLYNYKGVVFKTVILRHMREEGCQKSTCFALYNIWTVPRWDTARGNFRISYPASWFTDGLTKLHINYKRIKIPVKNSYSTKWHIWEKEKY